MSTRYVINVLRRLAIALTVTKILIVIVCLPDFSERPRGARGLRFYIYKLNRINAWLYFKIKYMSSVLKSKISDSICDVLIAAEILWFLNMIYLSHNILPSLIKEKGRFDVFCENLLSFLHGLCYIHPAILSFVDSIYNYYNNYNN